MLFLPFLKSHEHRSQDECFSTAGAASSFPIPLPPPSSSDMCEGPENFTGELGSLFETPEDNDVSGKNSDFDSYHCNN